MADSAEWKEVFLEDLAEPTRNAIVGGPFGSDLVSSDYWLSGVPVIRGENLSEGRWVSGRFVFVSPEKAEQLSANTAGPLDLVFTQRGANHYRQVAVVPKDAVQRFVISQSQMKITIDKNKADPIFVYYLFRAPAQQEYLLRNAIQTGVPHTNLSILRKVPLTIPPMVTQRRIAHILGTLDDKIELNRRMNETLEAIARALFKSWFVDFDPVRAKAECRDTDLPAHIADLFPNSFEDSELGEIPDGWGTLRLHDLLTLDKGVSYKGQYLTDSGIPMVNLGCFLGRGRFDNEALKNYSGEYRPRHIVRPGDLVIANTDITQKREVIGSPALVPQHFGSDELLFTHHVFCARFRTGCEHWKFFVLFLLLQESFRERAAGFATGTTVLALPRDAVLELACPAVPRELIKAFERMATPLLERQSKSVSESLSLAALRDTLLPKLMSGELKTIDAEQRITEAGS
jgi:type I restriction enzyme S subunit